MYLSLIEFHSITTVSPHSIGVVYTAVKFCISHLVQFIFIPASLLLPISRKEKRESVRYIECVSCIVETQKAGYHMCL